MPGASTATPCGRAALCSRRHKSARTLPTLRSAMWLGNKVRGFAGGTMRPILAVAACVALLAACSKPADTPAQTETEIADAKAAPFDLRCTGSARLNVWGPADFDPPKPFDIKLRIDLAQKAWCQDACDSIYQIIATEPQTITLASKVVGAEGSKTIYETTVNRLSGEYRAGAMPTIYTLATAKCEKLPFSGFPQAKF